MPVGFGFSFGDFVSGISLVHNLITALQESGGSSKEYLELIAELRSLETALVQIQAQYKEIELPAQRIALEQTVDACQESIDDFLGGVNKYHHHLNIHGTQSRARDALRKIQWHLTKATELEKFRCRVSLHVQSIQTLLVTTQVSSLAMTRRQSEAQGSHGQDQAHQMSNMSHSLVLINSSLDTLRQQLVDQGPIAEQTLVTVDTVKQLMSANNAQLLVAIKQLQKSLPPQVLLQKPVIFTDALDRIAPVHLDWITSWDSFLAVLEIRFKDLGQSKVRNREFTLQEAVTRRVITFQRPFDVSVTPGQAVDMSMIFLDGIGGFTQTLCPHCQSSCNGGAEEDIECTRCGCHFRRKRHLYDTPEAPGYNVTIDVIDKKRAMQLSRKRRRSDSDNHHDNVQPSDFKRIQMLCFPSLRNSLAAAFRRHFAVEDGKGRPQK